MGNAEHMGRLLLKVIMKLLVVFTICALLAGPSFGFTDKLKEQFTNLLNKLKEIGMGALATAAQQALDAGKNHCHSSWNNYKVLIHLENASCQKLTKLLTSTRRSRMPSKPTLTRQRNSTDKPSTNSKTWLTKLVILMLLVASKPSRISSAQSRTRLMLL